MGGKVAMFFAEKYPDLLKKLVVVDIAPRYYQPHHQQILAGFRSVALPLLSSRQDAENAMMQHIDDAGVRQFLLKNLYRTDEGGFDWRVNLDVIEAGIEEVGKAFESANKVKVPTLFIRGGNSRYIQERDEADIQQLFESAEIQTIENAGHWVHAEQPQAVYQAIISFLNR
jgi:pimeloyl-ACP methyl ester carboxylesterase